MERTTRSKVLWTVWMSLGGIAFAAVTWVLTASVGWTILALLASGTVLNTIGQMITQPIRAATGDRHGRPGRAGPPVST